MNDGPGEKYHRQQTPIHFVFFVFDALSYEVGKPTNFYKIKIVLKFFSPDDRI
jgi:hypothetical protein